MAATPLPDPNSSSSSSTTTSSSPSIMDSIVPISTPITIKLTESNYLTWSSQITPLLHGYDLMKFIYSSSPEPTRTTSAGVVEINPTFLAWRRHDQLLLSWLRSSLTESILAQVVSCTTSLDLWLTLQKLSASNSRAHVIDLKRQVNSASKAATSGLGSNYNPVVATISASSRLQPFSFADLRGVLLSHEALLKHQTDTMALSTPSAFAVGRGGGFRNRPQFQQNNQFRPQFRPNSPQFDGNPLLPNPLRPQFRPNPSQFDGAMSNSNGVIASKPSCQICFKPDHSAKLCYSRYFPDPEWKPNPRFQAYNAQIQPQSISTSDWIIDSGATNHVTSDLNNLSSFYSYQGPDNLQIENVDKFATTDLTKLCATTAVVNTTYSPQLASGPASTYVSGNITSGLAFTCASRQFPSDPSFTSGP
ncbi:hypothetical protein LUZ63_016575 [Rhynchospora breviuscula]|uniref:Retrotransposon Copia-like N-terminal domain-containing protein n=1 Tax=Rhynchospora breviuscula TaxID=2022672 RepID=A0A9Q0C0G5_9POAL|nr:hypothetical protein LUZ63_016575 [Rhynchospora breviuscula]